MIEYKLAWKLTDEQAETVQRETMAIIEFLLCRAMSDTRRESDVYKTISLIAHLESLAIVIAAYTSSEADDETEKILEALTYILKRSVREIRASDAAEKLIARLQAKQRKNKRRKPTRNPD